MILGELNDLLQEKKRNNILPAFIYLIIIAVGGVVQLIVVGEPQGSSGLLQTSGSRPRVFFFFLKWWNAHTSHRYRKLLLILYQRF